VPGTASNSRLKKSHEFTRLLLEKADMRVVIPKAAHLMSYQNPPAFNEALLYFLAQQ